MKHHHPFSEEAKKALLDIAEHNIKEADTDLETYFMSVLVYLAMCKSFGMTAKQVVTQQATYIHFKTLVEVFERTYPDEQINFTRPTSDSASEGTEEASTQE